MNGWTATRGSAPKTMWCVTVCLMHFALCASADAQQSKIPRVGYVSNNTASSPGPLVEAFRQGLRELGYTDQRNIVLEYRYAEGNEERIATLVNELVHKSVDLLVVPSGIGAKDSQKSDQNHSDRHDRPG